MGPWAMLILVALVAGGVWYGARWWLYAAAHVSTDDASVDANMVQVAPKIGGRIARLLAETGSKVMRGQLVAQLHTEDLEAAVGRAAAAAAAAEQNVRQAEAGLAYARASASSQDAGAQAGLAGRQVGVSQAQTAASLEQRRVDSALRQARAALTSADADAKTAATNLQRMEYLFSQGAVSAQQRDAAGDTATAAEARLKVAEADLALAEAGRAQVKIREDDVATARAATRQAQAAVSAAAAARLQVQQAEAGLDAARAQAKGAQESLRLAKIALHDASVYSPTDGVVSQKLAEPGEMVAPGQPLFTVTQRAGPSSVWVVANLKETEIRRVRVGQPASFTVDAYPGRTFRGHVMEITAATQSQFSLIPAQQPSGSFTKVTQRIPVKISVDDNHEVRLVPGMSAVVAIDVRGSSGAGGKGIEERGAGGSIRGNPRGK